MSHWKDIAIDMECSIEVLRRILINIMPAWDKYIQLDPSGKLTAKSHYQPNEPTTGCSIVIPMGNETGVVGTDIGFIQVGSGKWKMKYDYKPQTAQDLEYRIKQEYATIHTIEEAKVKGLQVAEETTEGDDNIIRILVPEDYEPNQFEA